MQVECPWCDAPLAVGSSADAEVRCEPCRIVVELADDERPAESALAA